MRTQKFHFQYDKLNVDKVFMCAKSKNRALTANNNYERIGEKTNRKREKNTIHQFRTKDNTIQKYTNSKNWNSIIAQKKSKSTIDFDLFAKFEK